MHLLREPQGSEDLSALSLSRKSTPGVLRVPPNSRPAGAPPSFRMSAPYSAGRLSRVDFSLHFLQSAYHDHPGEVLVK